METQGLEGNTLRFEFTGAGNLKSPNDGHMHRVQLTFEDSEHLLSEWTFYDNGKPQFTEKLRYSRIPGQNPALQ
jgi:hypothetical protein